MKATTLLWLAGVVLLLNSQLLQAEENPRFTGLGFLPGTYRSEAYGISNDGKIVVGTSDYNTAFRWVEGNDMEGIGDLPGGSESSQAYAISQDGSVIVGESDSGGPGGREAFHWEDGILTGLGYPDDSASIGSRAFGVSISPYNGTEFVVGEGDTKQLVLEYPYPVRTAFTWEQQVGPAPVWLPVTEQGYLAAGGAWAKAVSEDGAKIAGTLIIAAMANKYHAFWSDGETYFDIHDGNEALDDIFSSYGNGISANGRFIVGNTKNDPYSVPIVLDWGAFVYDTDNQTFIKLPFLNDDLKRADAVDISADGSIICGNSTVQRWQSSTDLVATIWVHQGNYVYTPISLQQLAEDNEIDLQGWWLSYATAITEDGRYIVGTGSHGPTEGYRLDISGLVEGVSILYPPEEFIKETEDETEDMGDGWRKVSWYGLFKRMEKSHHWHTEHGWQYIGKGKADDLQIYDHGLGCWSWTSEKDYPYIYVYCLDSGWTYYKEGGEPGNREYYDFVKGKWIHENEIHGGG